MNVCINGNQEYETGWSDLMIDNIYLVKLITYQKGTESEKTFTLKSLSPYLTVKQDEDNQNLNVKIIDQVA